MLDKMLRMGALLDVHGPLLTEHQREMCVLYYLIDYSLAEISELYGVSRQAVHDTLARAERAMEGHEETFGLLRMAEERRKRVGELDSQLSDADFQLEMAMASLDEAERSAQRPSGPDLAGVRRNIEQTMEIIASARRLVASIDSGDGGSPGMEDD